MMTAVSPTAFLRALFGNVDAGCLTLFSIDPATGSRSTDWFDHGDLEAMADHAVKIGGLRDVWFGLAPRLERLAAGRRGGKDDCVGITCVWVDIDIAGPNHKDVAGILPTLEQARELVRSFPLQPSIIVATGGGYHVYWLLDEMVAGDDAAVLLERWAATWAERAIERKVHVDNVFDLARVLRMPGTLNHKNNGDTPVDLIQCNTEVVYAYSDLLDVTIDPPKAAPTPEERRMPYTGAERPGDDFNARHTCGDVLALAGWAMGKPKPNGDERWLHPWSPKSDESATVYADDGHCTVWSDTVPQNRPAIVVRRPYDAFGLYAALEHNGDHREASIELAKRGYGASRMRDILGYQVPIELVTEHDGATDVRRDDKAAITVNGMHLDDLADEVVRILMESNDPPRLFRHGQTVSQFARGELEAIDRNRMVHIVERTMRPYRVSKDGVFSPARLDVATLELAMLRLLDLLPTVNGVVRSPFMRADGSICAEAGYDPVSGNFLAATTAIVVPDAPTQAEIAAAVALVDSLMTDFPFSTASDRAHVFAMLLTPMVRHLVPLVPLFVIDGSGPGVGKNLLTECCMYVSTGEWIQTDPLPLDSEEQRKQITALMSTGRAVALFDEAHIVSGTSLARLITSTTWGDRLLGYSKQVSYPNRITVVALGNNVEVQGDMPRRTIMVRLESPDERPFDRQEFYHSDLRAWTEQHREQMLGALLTILRAWHHAGRPPSPTRLGSFDQWAAMIGGALNVAGVDGFLGNVGAMRDRGATDDLDMEAHVQELNVHFYRRAFTAKQVAGLAEREMLEADPPRLGGHGKTLTQSLGHAYRRYSGRWMGGLRIVPDGVTGGARRWVVEARPVDNSPKTGGLGGLGGLVLPTHEVLDQEKIKKPENPPVGEMPEWPENSPPSPPSPPLRHIPDTPAVDASSVEVGW